ncbi:prepilin-type N-terminal cleavage/methylation domain-containing protein [Lentibacillus lipolyticus]|nr:prepilin-type N-terminal cleavage/methylation domain-containing protein [Lentibacillus lipolyticus]
MIWGKIGKKTATTIPKIVIDAIISIRVYPLQFKLFRPVFIDPLPSSTTFCLLYHVIGCVHMTFRRLKNEKGLTLVELLAALSLLGILIGLSSALVFQLMANEEQISKQISLRQDTNVTINELRHQFEEGNDTLCIQQQGINYAFSEVTNGQVDGTCLTITDNEKPLSFKLTATNDAGQTFEMKTTWDNKKAYVLNIEPDKGEGNHPTCEFTGTAELESLTLKKGFCNNKYDITGSLVVRNLALLEENVKLKISGSAHFNGDIRLFHKAQIVTSGSIQVDGQVFCGDKEVPVHKKKTLKCKNP